MNNRVVSYVITLPHATRMMKKLNARKHAHMGYYFELNELGCTILEARKMPGLAPEYAAYGTRARNGNPGKEDAFLLRVYRDV